jgi:hypothetical protein
MGTSYAKLNLLCPGCNKRFNLKTYKKDNKNQWSFYRESNYCPDCLSLIVNKTVIYDKNKGKIPKNLLHYLK